MANGELVTIVPDKESSRSYRRDGGIYMLSNRENAERSKDGNMLIKTKVRSMTDIDTGVVRAMETTIDLTEFFDKNKGRTVRTGEFFSSLQTMVKQDPGTGHTTFMKVPMTEEQKKIMDMISINPIYGDVRVPKITILRTYGKDGKPEWETSRDGREEIKTRTTWERETDAETGYMTEKVTKMIQDRRDWSKRDVPEVISDYSETITDSDGIPVSQIDEKYHTDPEHKRFGEVYMYDEERYDEMGSLVKGIHKREDEQGLMHGKTMSYDEDGYREKETVEDERYVEGYRDKKEVDRTETWFACKENGDIEGKLQIASTERNPFVPEIKTEGKAGMDLDYWKERSSETEEEPVYESENVRVFVSDGPLTVFADKGEEGKKAKTVITLNPETGSMMVYAGEKDGQKAAEDVIRDIWKNECPTLWSGEPVMRSGLAVTPPSIKCGKAELIRAIMAVEEKLEPPLSMGRISDIKKVPGKISEAFAERGIKDIRSDIGQNIE